MISASCQVLPLGLHNSAFRWVCPQKPPHPSLGPTTLWLDSGSLPTIPPPEAVVALAPLEQPRESLVPADGQEEAKSLASVPERELTEAVVGRHSMSGKWTEEEHTRFLEAMDRFGNDWRCARAHIGTRSSAQIRSHAQKYYYTLRKKAIQKAKADPSSRRAIFVVTREYWHKSPLPQHGLYPKPGRSPNLHLDTRNQPRPSSPSRPRSPPRHSPSPSAGPSKCQCPASSDCLLKPPARLESQLSFTSLSSRLQTESAHCSEPKESAQRLNSLTATPANDTGLRSTVSSNSSPSVPHAPPCF